MWQQDIPHTTTTRLAKWKIDTRQDGSMLSCSFLCQILTLHRNIAAEIETFQTRQHFSSPLFWAHANSSLSFLLIADSSGSWCGLLLQGCLFRNALLHTWIVISVYLNDCCLPISLKQCNHSPPTSGINQTFSPIDLLLIRYFLFVAPKPCHLNNFFFPFWCLAWTLEAFSDYVWASELHLAAPFFARACHSR